MMIKDRTFVIPTDRIIEIVNRNHHNAISPWQKYIVAEQVYAREIFKFLENYFRHADYHFGVLMDLQQSGRLTVLTNLILSNYRSNFFHKLHTKTGRLIALNNAQHSPWESALYAAAKRHDLNQYRTVIMHNVLTNVIIPKHYIAELKYYEQTHLAVSNKVTAITSASDQLTLEIKSYISDPSVRLSFLFKLTNGLIKVEEIETPIEQALFAEFKDLNKEERKRRYRELKDLTAAQLRNL